jgi:putative flippase GtrA
LVVFCGFCVDFLIYSILVFHGISIYVSNLAAFFVGTILNVILIRKLVFRDNRFKFLTDIQLTFAANGATLGLGVGILWGLVELCSFNPYLAKLLTNGITIIINYLIRILFFRKK